MTILCDRQIRELALAGMITPFVESQKGKGIVSYGLSSYGYDLRLGNVFKMSVGESVLDPTNVGEGDFFTVTVTDHFDIPARSFVLACTMETLHLPPDVTGLLKDKSTYARCGISVQNTVFEAGWQGVPTLELVNHLDRPVRLHVGQGIGQMLFFRGEPCEVSYSDRGGKYQGQTGVTLAKVLS